ncbi:ATP-dependent helicase HrpB [Silicimonas algicola]|uniref:ATP-dependent helicase HrpB n=1 Tax=Silicimonas algicola TaxID=1826607 RepID=A0A316GBV8_9RHOB|nr:ATP-dependent helicase HrpB [Silicimonas algicola]AZQ66095.1 ATP-dependent helicase HrpB [Silicimonas algicola]PWK58398.1 ATP-dependent helicase HrpB [Silicimonas algicola]
MDALPIDDALPDLIAALRERRQAVLQAPPGAGKTTRVPLALLDAGLTAGRIVMLEPRRIAARTAAERMAATLGEEVGQTVGYRIRGEAKVSPATRIEVVTEGILTRTMQRDPSLSGVGAVIFDEFHERSLNADLGLALALEVRQALREDLLLLVMSATLEAGPVAQLMGNAPVVTSVGRSYPVDTRWLDRPRGREARFDADLAALVRQALTEEEGSVLAFLPGEGEIRRVARLLGDAGGVEVLPLYGALPFVEQRRALTPSGHRRVVLATAIAETSLTLPDIRIVVDGGLARRARFDPGSGMSRLLTERVTKAEADQRRGRAGRVAPGVCFRLWTKGEEGALAPFPPAEIETADLAALALSLAEWGSGDLPFLTAPPEGALLRARELLRDLDALDAEGRITPHGRALAAMPLHPRLGHMLARAGRGAALLAALLSDGDPLRGAGADLGTRLAALKGRDRTPTLDRIRAEARRLEKSAGDGIVIDPAEQAALAYPDRIALRRPDAAPRWLTSGGKGVKMDAADPLAGTRLIVVTDTDGHPTEATIRTALPLSEAAVRTLYSSRIVEVREARWSQADGRVVATVEERLGALVLSTRPWTDVPSDLVALAMLDGVRALGLGLSSTAKGLQARVKLLRDAGHDLADLSDETLLTETEVWLLAYIDGVRTAGEWKAFDLTFALDARLGHAGRRLVDREAPAHFETPLGRRIAIDYGGDAPEISLRLQEMFGVTRHPVVAGRPLRVTLLSPAGRPVQTTMDLPGFWSSSYAEVRKDMRGRYPKHPWPEDPTAANPTLRAKPRS